jgi:hypothetical protein
VLEVEADSFVDDFDDELLRVDSRVNVDLLGGILLVSPEDGVRQRFGESNGNIERDLPFAEGHDLAFATDQLDNALNVTNVARDVDVDDTDLLARRLVLDRQVHGLTRRRSGDAREEWSEAVEGALASIRNLKECVELRELEQRLQIVVEIGEAELSALFTDLFRE